MQALVDQLIALAAVAGPMHAYWDVIVDGEALLQGTAPRLSQDVAEWVSQAELLLDAAKPWTLLR